MRLKRLSLDRFGHFTDQQFDFGSAHDGHDFHIIYGRNEAGKTTTMEAVLRLFYGFPTREAYAFRHPRNNLQISATLDFNGELRQFTRLPTRSGALVDESGTPLPEAALSAHLAGLSEPDYRRLLCLDDETIERGGEEIANAQGDIGRLLFSAAAGVADLSQVLDGVRSRADEIWKKRARNTRMRELKRALEELDKEIKARDVSANAWKSLKRDLTKAQQAEEDARTRRDDLNTTRARTEAERRAVPLLAELQELEQALAPFADFPAQLDFNPERLVELRSDLGSATQNIARLSDELQTLEEEQAALVLDPALEALPAALEALEDLSARHRTAALDLDRRKAEQQEALETMRQAARDLGLVAENADLAALVLSGTDITALQDAREQLRAAITHEGLEAREVEDLEERLRVAQDAVHDCAPLAAEAGQLQELLLNFDAERLATAHAAAVESITAAQSRAARSLAALSVRDVTFDTLPHCPSSLRQAQEHADRDAALVQDLRRATETRNQHKEDASARAAQAKALERAANVVSDSEAEALRTKRDALWAVHVDSLDAESAATFHEALSRHDTAADARLTQSRELAQLREIAQSEAASKARAAEAAARITALEEQRDAIAAEVNAAATQLGLAPLSPAEWRDWVERHETARTDAEALRDTKDSHAATFARAKALMDALSERVPSLPADLDPALAQARRMAEAARQTSEARGAAEKLLRQVERDLNRRQDRHNAAQEAKKKAEDTWRALVQDLLAGQVSPKALMASLEPLRVLREHDKTRSAAARRVRMMEADQALFAQEVNALAQLHGVGVSSDPGQTYGDLKSLAETARTARDKAARLERAIATATAERADNTARVEAIDQELRAIAASFPEPPPAQDIDALRQCAAQAQKVIADRAARDRLRRQILSELDLSDLESARAQLAETSVATLNARLESTLSDLTHAEDDLTQAIQQRVTAEHALAEIDGDRTAAALVEQKATLELQLEEAALEHLELSLGHHLASDAINRYRDSHRSGMLTATEQCFADLTQGAYPALSTQIDGDSEVLLAVDRTGASKRADEMSKGTRFQLYLALRAAAHEQLVAQGTILPFFCDDIFETFDETRTSAACQVMEAIGTRGQAIYLTHHRHVVEIAQSVCATPPIIHEL